MFKNWKTQLDKSVFSSSGFVFKTEMNSKLSLYFQTKIPVSYVCYSWTQ